MGRIPLALYDNMVSDLIDILKVIGFCNQVFRKSIFPAFPARYLRYRLECGGCVVLEEKAVIYPFADFLNGIQNLRARVNRTLSIVLPVASYSMFASAAAWSG